MTCDPEVIRSGLSIKRLLNIEQYWAVTLAINDRKTSPGKTTSDSGYT